MDIKYLKLKTRGSMFNIPFIKNPGGQCMQACIKMVLDFYFPGNKIGFNEINEKMGRQPGKWTIPSQAVVALDEFGIKARAFAENDLPENLEATIEFYKGLFGKDFSKQKKYLDLKAYFELHMKAKSVGLFELRKHTVNDFHKYFGQGHIVIPAIDYNILREKEGLYLGHFVAIIDMDKDNVVVHDPDAGASLAYPVNRFSQAFKAKEIDDDVLVICGKK